MGAFTKQGHIRGYTEQLHQVQGEANPKFLFIQGDKRSDLRGTPGEEVFFRLYASNDKDGLH